LHPVACTPYQPGQGGNNAATERNPAMAVLLTIGPASAFAAATVPCKAKGSGSSTHPGQYRLQLIGSATCDGGFAIRDDRTSTSTDTGATIARSVDR